MLIYGSLMVPSCGLSYKCKFVNSMHGPLDVQVCNVCFCLFVCWLVGWLDSWLVGWLVF